MRWTIIAAPTACTARAAISTPRVGANDATEEFKPLENHPDDAEAGSQGPKQTNAGERS